MKIVTYTAAIFMAMTAASSALAHHPAADMVDPEIYEMIDENVADTPHADMVFDDMGSAMESVTDNSAMDQAERELSGPEMSQAGVIVEIDPAMDTAYAVDTIDLMENVDGALAE